jgi:hypothetical protein
MRLLLVEDDAAIQVFLRRSLSEAGCQVDAASDAKTWVSSVPVLILSACRSLGEPSQTAKYKHVPFEQATQGNETRISGTIPARYPTLRSTHRALIPACEERNTRPRRNDLAEGEMTWQRHV